MPPLSGVPVGAEEYEEPHRLGDDRGFSPPGLGVRNPTVQPRIQTARFGGQTHYSPITDASPVTATALRGTTMLECYNNSVTSHTLGAEDKSHINDVTKKHILGKLKFVQQKKDFGSFWKPDLLKDTLPYVDVFFD
jgi:hypothetical protein